MMQDQAKELRIISLDNQLLLARIAQRMLEPSQIDNHYTWQRRSSVTFIAVVTRSKI